MCLSVSVCEGEGGKGCRDCVRRDEEHMLKNYRGFFALRPFPIFLFLSFEMITREREKNQLSLSHRFEVIAINDLKSSFLLKETLSEMD